jgi:hypothetical protein
MRGTDNALLAASAPTNFGDLSITATTGLVDINDKTGFDLNADQSGVTIGTVNSATVVALTAAAIADLFEVDSTKVASDAIDGSAILETVKGVWDRVISAANHNISGSSGRRLRNITDIIIHEGTSQGGGNQNIILDNGASAVDGTYDPGRIIITSGTGIGQSRQIMEYTGSTRTAYIKRDWKVNPDATSNFIILADSGNTHVNEGLAQGGTATSITLNTLASAVDETYTNQTVFIVSGTGQDQARTVTAYNGTTKVATVETWQTNPDATSVYIMLPAGAGDLDAIVETGVSVKDALQGTIAALYGKTVISGQTVNFRDQADTKNRIVAVTDTNDQRTSITTSYD